MVWGEVAGLFYSMTDIRKTMVQFKSSLCGYLLEFGEC